MSSTDLSSAVLLVEQALYAQKDLPNAIAQCAILIQQIMDGHVPKSPEIARCLAVAASICAKSGRMDLCLRCADEAISIAPLWPIPYSRRGAALLSMGLHEQALKMFEFAQQALDLGRSPLPTPKRELNIITRGLETCQNIHTIVEANTENDDDKEFDRYPSTPHLQFSPQIHVDDVVSLFQTETFCNQEIVITEKLDGGNCCLSAGKVFARTHKHETSHESFGPVKAKLIELRDSQKLLFAEIDRLGLRIFGENMFGVHSIDYGELQHPFYAFSVHGRYFGRGAVVSVTTHTTNPNEFILIVERFLVQLEGDNEHEQDFRIGWYSWCDTVALCACLDLPLVPTVFFGVLENAAELRAMLASAATVRSAVSMDSEDVVTPEGFVVRHTCAFPTNGFDGHIAKYVRVGHNQTSDDWMRTWRKAALSDPRSLSCPVEQLENANLQTSNPWHWFNSNSRIRKAVRNLLNSLATQYTHVVNSDNTCTHTLVDAEAKTDDPGAEYSIRKFPRIPHLIASNSATVDDVILNVREAQAFLKRPLIVQEKMDGANLGFSLTADYQIRVQNRSHFVNPETSEQFHRLDAWIATHRFELCDILRPGRDVLFGEWLFARHSRHYTRLPDFFLAFDLYDSHTNSFATLAEMTEKLHSTTIQMVPNLGEHTFEHMNEIKALMEQQSAYANDFVEGVVLRIEAAGQLQRRAKLVRPDFTQAIDEGMHWMKRKLERNQCASVIEVENARL